MLETQKVVQARRQLGHDWLVFVEVPLRYITEHHHTVVYVDVMLVLDGTWPGVPIEHCVLAIEHNGTTHQHAWKVRNDRLTGYEKQLENDRTKAAAVASHGIKLLTFTVERSDRVSDGILSKCNTNSWSAKLSEAMMSLEDATYVSGGAW